MSEPITLPLLGPDDPPAPGKSDHLLPGQYVVHDTPDLVLPYLPDPLARGVSFVFQEAGLERSIPFPFGTEGFTAVYRGSWPEIQPSASSSEAASCQGSSPVASSTSTCLPVMCSAPARIVAAT